MAIIPYDKSVIPACDTSFERFEQIVRETAGMDGIGGWKVGVSFLDRGLSAVVASVRATKTDKPVIYDHQKAGTDIPESTPDEFMDAMVRAGINAVILFPQAGPITEYEWISAAQKKSLGVIVGGEMTHPRYLDGDVSSGKKKDYSAIFRELGFERDLPGYIRTTAPDDMYELAARMGVTDFVVPGNKPDRVRHYKSLVERCGIAHPVFYAPGFVAQGGNVSEAAQAAGERWHAIIGRDIHQAKGIRQAVLELTAQL